MNEKNKIATKNKCVQSIEFNNTDQKQTNGWEELIPYIDPDLITAIDDFSENVEKISPIAVIWMKNTGVNYEWFNHIFFAAYVLAISDIRTQNNVIGTVNSFIKHFVPDPYPEINMFNPTEAINIISSEISTTLATTYFSDYQQCQLHENVFLFQNGKSHYDVLQKYQLPKLVANRKIKQMTTNVQKQARKRKKQEVFGVLQKWNYIREIIPKRYQWIKKLESKYQEIMKGVSEQKLLLPQEIEMPGFDAVNDTLRFIVWNKHSWSDHHRNWYSTGHLYEIAKLDKYSNNGFIEFVGDIPENDWFLEAILLGCIQGGPNLSAKAIEYMDLRKIPHKKFFTGSTILNSAKKISSSLRNVRKKTKENSQTSHIIFSIEPLLISATIGALCFMAITRTAARVSELLQLCMDRSCLGGMYLANIDLNNEQRNSDNLRYLWFLYPKGRKNKREAYEVDEVINSLLYEYIELQKRYDQNPLNPIFPNPRFAHIDKFPGKNIFVFRRDGKHCTKSDINACIAFITLNHGCKKSNGDPVHITSHTLRHIAATHQNLNGASFENLMKLLHHINPDTTSYYSELPIEHVIQEIIPILEEMSEEIYIDPYSLRNIDEVRDLVRNIIKMYGAVRNIPGGKCGSYKSCKKLFLCASCSNFIPCFSKKSIREILRLIEDLETGAIIYEKEGNILKARFERENIEKWRLILHEIHIWRNTNQLPAPNNFPIGELYESEMKNHVIFTRNDSENDSNKGSIVEGKDE